MIPKPYRCDLFCRVIDNFGDVGVCWRLARQFAHEHGLAVRLWVDHPDTLETLVPEAKASLHRQHLHGVEVCRWLEPFPAVSPADLVIEAFACELPPAYLAAMADLATPPVWINLDYLSAEAWVEGCHKHPSPHPRLALTKYFFFPGFTRHTGGLLQEQDLLERRDVFQGDPARQASFWARLGMETPDPGTLKVSLFSYENDAVGELIDTWAAGEHPILCLVPEGRVLPLIGRHFHDDAPHARSHYTRGCLRVQALPFLAQDRYDELLWACDVNFVRGEESFVRAQWAGRPFIWQIYPQQDGVHRQKLQAFLDRYTASLDALQPPLGDGAHAASALVRLWRAWNGESGIGPAWRDFQSVRGALRHGAQDWARKQAKNNLARNLLSFFQETVRLRESRK
jgi:uncharacterized repeat protein (TIGR03837 family)